VISVPPVRGSEVRAVVNTRLRPTAVGQIYVENKGAEPVEADCLGSPSLRRLSIPNGLFKNRPVRLETCRPWVSKVCRGQLLNEDSKWGDCSRL
jgi:hypothetical protein